MELVPGKTAAIVPASIPHRGTLRENERDLIRRTLDECDWVVGGPGGAARKLGLKRTTLLSKMKKLGLARPSRNPVE
jgi:formate hydrogenlyase transcriptional activator